MPNYTLIITPAIAERLKRVAQKREMPTEKLLCFMVTTGIETLEQEIMENSTEQLSLDFRSN